MYRIAQIGIALALAYMVLTSAVAPVRNLNLAASALLTATKGN